MLMNHFVASLLLLQVSIVFVAGSNETDSTSWLCLDNYAIYGFDITELSISDLESCKNACLSLSTCKSIDLRPALEICYLNNAAHPSAAVNPDTNFDHCIRGVHWHCTDGLGLSTQMLDQAVKGSLSECQNWCLESTLCLSIHFLSSTCTRVKVGLGDLTVAAAALASPLVCQLDTAECDSQPCSNGGSCVEGLQSYSCLCPVTSWGTQCEYNSTACESSPCLNGGSCAEASGNYSCSCSTLYKGDRCQTAQPCMSSPCQNGGTCLTDPDFLSYSCVCPQDFAGLNCQLNRPTWYCVDSYAISGYNILELTTSDVEVCKDACLNTTNCASVNYKSAQQMCYMNYVDCNSMSIHADTNYQHCSPGFSWHCLDNVAIVNNTLDESGTLDLTQCQEWCLQSSICKSIEFQADSGTCLRKTWALSDPGVVVTYDESSLNCQLDALECDSQPCLNGGSCIEDLANYSCSCPDNTLGDNCESLVLNFALEDRVTVSGSSLGLDPTIRDGNDTTCSLLEPDSDLSIRAKLKLNYDVPLVNVQLNLKCSSTYNFKVKVFGQWPLNREYSCNQATERIVIEKEELQSTAAGVDYSAISLRDISGSGMEVCEMKAFIGNPCENDPCQNGATCSPSSDFRSYTCSCPPGFMGSKCDGAIYNAAKGRRPTDQEDPAPELSNMVDGDVSSCRTLSNTSADPWWGVDFGYEYTFTLIQLHFGCKDSSFSVTIQISNEAVNQTEQESNSTTVIPEMTTIQYTEQRQFTVCEDHRQYPNGLLNLFPYHFTQQVIRYVSLQSSQPNTEICDIQVFVGGPCASSPCSSSATCKEEPTLGDSAYSCPCDEFSDAQSCSLVPCINNKPCENGATCMVQSQRNHFCLCQTDFAGDTCSFRNECNFEPCQNGGSCLFNKLDGSFNCLCPEGFIGPNCSISAENVASNRTTSCSTFMSPFMSDLAVQNETSFCFSSISQTEPWWAVDLGTILPIRVIRIWMPKEAVAHTSFHVGVANSTPAHSSDYLFHFKPCAVNPTGVDDVSQTTFEVICDSKENILGQYVMVHYYQTIRLILCSVQVYLDTCWSQPCLNGGTCYSNATEFACFCLPSFSGTTCEKDLSEACFNSTKSIVDVLPNDMDQKTMIMMNMTFHCSGQVVGWHYFGKQDGHSVMVGVWAVNDNSTLTLMGSETLTTKKGEHYLSVEEKNYLTVQEGFVLGIHHNKFSSDISSALYWVKQSHAEYDSKLWPESDLSDTVILNIGNDDLEGNRTVSFTGSSFHTTRIAPSLVPLVKPNDTPQCWSNPCWNFGSCDSLSTSGYSCICPFGYTGSHCEFEDTCTNSPCPSYAQCLNVGDTAQIDCFCNETISAQCQKTYHGLTSGYGAEMKCVIPFQFHGVTHNNCTRPSAWSQALRCPLEYYATEDSLWVTCGGEQVFSDWCMSLPCKNGGTCVLSWDSANYTCSCKIGFGGKDCQTEVTNIALSKNVENKPFSFTFHPWKAVDGVEDEGSFTLGASCTYLSHATDNYFIINLDNIYRVAEVRIRPYMEMDENLYGLYIGVSNTSDIQHSYSGEMQTYKLCSYHGGYVTYGAKLSAPCLPENIEGSYVIIQKMGANTLAVCEIEVYEDPCLNVSCANGGTCTNRGLKYYCVCPAGFYGQLCAQEHNNGVTDLQPLNDIYENEYFVEIFPNFQVGEDSYFTQVEYSSQVALNGEMYVCGFHPVYEGDAVERFELLNATTLYGPAGHHRIKINPIIVGPGDFFGVIFSNQTQFHLRSGTSPRWRFLLSSFGLEAKWTLDDLQRINCSSVSCSKDSDVSAPAIFPLLFSASLGECYSSPCLNFGTCVFNMTSGFQCVCPDGFYGDTCQMVDLCYNMEHCNGAGSCIMNETTHNYSCDCLSNAVGVACQFPNPCWGSLNQCQNEVTCVPDEASGAFECLCGDDYRGTYCSFIRHCQSNPCQNGGVCLDEDGGYTCQCQHGYIGLHCEHDDPCRPNPCQMYGTCIRDYLSAHYECSCQPELIGHHCQFVNPCMSSPCQNGATCNSFYQNITTTARESLPEITTPEMTSASPGQSSITQETTENPTTAFVYMTTEDWRVSLNSSGQPTNFTCTCPDGYTGTLCQFGEIGGCNFEPCKNGATCLSDGLDYQCICPSYTEGNGCQHYQCVQKTYIPQLAAFPEDIPDKRLHIFPGIKVTCDATLVVGVTVYAVRTGIFRFGLFEHHSEEKYVLQHLFHHEITEYGVQNIMLSEEIHLAGSNWAFGIWTTASSNNVVPYIDSVNGPFFDDLPVENLTTSLVMAIDSSSLKKGSVIDTTFYSRPNRHAVMQPLLSPVLSCEVKFPTGYQAVINPFIISLSKTTQIEAFLVGNACSGTSLKDLGLTWLWRDEKQNKQLYTEIEPQPAMLTWTIAPFGVKASLYHIRLTSAVLQSSTSMYMTTYLADLVAIIAGGTARSVTLGKSVTLDGNTLSSDPADQTKLVNFGWSCRVGGRTSALSSPDSFGADECPSVWSWIYSFTDGVLSLDMDGIDPDEYTFRLVVWKDDRTAFYDQVINVVDGYIPNIKIGCKVNCQKQVVPTSKLSLYLASSDEDDDVNAGLLQLQFKWIIYQDMNGTDTLLDIAAITGSESTTGEGMVIRANALLPDKTYSLRVYINCPTCAESYADYSFQTNSPPVPGSCSASPQQGEAMKTYFTLQCQDWVAARTTEKELVPLTYEFSTISTEGVSILYSGSQPKSHAMFLAQGDPSNNYTVQFVATVTDMYGSSADYYFNASVTPTKLIIALDESGGGLTLNSLDAIFSSNNTKVAAAYIKAFAETLNLLPSGDEGVSVSVEQKKEIRKSMVKSLSNMVQKIKSPVAVKQASQGLSAALAKPEEIDEETMVKASDAVSNMALTSAKLTLDNPAKGEEICASVSGVSRSVIKVMTEKTLEAMTVTVSTEGMSPQEVAYYTAQAELQISDNAYAARKTAAETDSKIAEAMTVVADAVLSTLTLGEKISMDGDGLALKRVRADSASGSMTLTSGAMDMPSALEGVNGSSQIVGIQASGSQENTKQYGKKESEVTSGIMSLEIRDENGEPMDVEGDVEMAFPNDRFEPPQTVNASAARDAATGLTYSIVNTSAPQSYIQMEIAPPEEEPVVEVFVKYDIKPSASDYDYKTFIGNGSNTLSSRGMLALAFLAEKQGRYYIGYRGVQTEEKRRQKREVANTTDETETYSVAVGNSRCQAWDEDAQEWVNAGQMSETSTLDNVRCKLKPGKKFKTFGASCIAPPNLIDFSSVFSKFSDLAQNPVVFSVVIVLIVIWIILIVWSRRADKNDEVTWSHDELLDNRKDHKNFYLITVETGLKWSAGTNSQVFFILHGKLGNTGKRKFSSQNVKGFPMNSTRVFIMRTPEPLGELKRLTVWHDNSGKGRKKEWYPETFTVQGMRSGFIWEFVCRKWLGLNSDTGSLSVTLNRSAKRDTAQFKYVLSRTVTSKFTDAHMWASIFLRPFGSSFTRAQRTTCCMTALFMTMIVSAMFYGTDLNVQSPFTVELGPIRVTVQELFVSACSVAIVLPVNLLIIQIFRNVKLATLKVKPDQEAEYSDDSSNGDENDNDDDDDASESSTDESDASDSSDNEPATARHITLETGSSSGYSSTTSPDLDSQRSLKVAMRKPSIVVEDIESDNDVASLEDGDSDSDFSVYEDDEELDTDEEREEEQERRKKMAATKCLPRGCLPVGWCISVLSILTSAFFVILYSLDWGAEKANAWLVSYVTSFVQSVLIVDPIKVICIAAFTALLVWRAKLSEAEQSKDGKDGDDDSNLKEESELSPDEVERQRERAVMMATAKDTLKSLVAHALLLWVLLSISLMSNSSSGYFINKNIHNLFTDSFKSTVSSREEFFSWLHSEFIPNYFVETDYAGNKLSWEEKTLTADYQSFRLGSARLRQVRLPPMERCKGGRLYPTTRTCYGSYSLSKESEDTFGLPFENVTDNRFLFSLDSWRYNTSLELDSLPVWGHLTVYGGGGFAASLDINRDVSINILDELIKYRWLDRQTRAVFLEFSLFNVNVGMLTYITLLAEMPNSGGVIHYTKIQPLSVYSLDASSIYLAVCLTIFVIYVIYYIVSFFIGICKEKRKYLTKVQTWFNLTIIITSLGMIIFFAMRLLALNIAMNKLREDKNKFVSFAYVAALDASFKYCVAFTLSLAIIKLVFLLRLYKRISQLMMTLRKSVKPLGSVMVALVVLLLSYALYAYLYLNPYLQRFHTIISSIEAMLSMALGSFDVEEMYEVNPAFTWFFFTTYILLMNFFMLSILITVIMDSHYQFKDKQPTWHQHELINYLTKTLFSGLQKTSVTDATGVV